MKKFYLLPVALLLLFSFFSTGTSAQIFNKKKKIKTLQEQLNQCTKASDERSNEKFVLEKEVKNLKAALAEKDSLVAKLQKENRKLQTLLAQKEKDSLLKVALETEKPPKAPDPVEKKTTKTEPKVPVESKKKKVVARYTTDQADPTE